MQTADSALLLGRICVRVLDAKTGKELRREEKSNQLCVGAKHAACRLVSQVLLDDDFLHTKIWAIYAGTGNTAPTVEDTELDTVVFKKACVQPFSVDLVSGTIEARMIIESGEGNGNIFCEIGLFSRGSEADPDAVGITDVLMYARQLHGLIEKTSSIAIEYTWTLQILS